MTPYTERVSEATGRGGFGDRGVQVYIIPTTFLVCLTESVQLYKMCVILSQHHIS